MNYLAVFRSLPRPRLSIPGRVSIACAGLALAASLTGSFVPYVILYRHASDSLRAEVRERLKSVAQTAASQIDPRVHASIRTRADESSQPYRRLKATLAAIRKANPDVRYVYTMRKTRDPNTLQFVADAEADPKLASHVGEPYPTKGCPAMREAFFHSAVDDEPGKDRRGAWLSAYAPIRDDRNRAVGILGIDMSLAQLMRQQAGLRREATRNAVLATLLAVALSLMVTKGLLRPIRVFTRAAERVRSGDLDFQIPAQGSDEIARFAEAFNCMLDGLRTASRDFVTGVYNHGHFHERLADEIERSERYGRSLCVIILDIDSFWTVNESLGHPIGDSILRQLGSLLLESTRRSDIVARYGGDELAVVLPETTLEEGLAAAENLRAMIEAHLFRAVPMDQLRRGEPAPADQVFRLTVTVGIAVYPEHHTTKDGVIMSADIALCRAKHAARSCVLAYDPATAGQEGVDPHELYRVLHDPDAAAIQSLAAAVDAKDRYTHGHSERVVEYALVAAKALELDSDAIDAVKIAGLLHDLGKIGVPDSILTKPGKLTTEEMDVIKRHPLIGGNILRRAPQLGTVIPAVLFHHERWDGNGYPDGLAGEAIPLAARILAIADSFDAMTSDRPYRTALSVEAALEELRANAGKQFDPRLVEAFVAYYEQIEQSEAA